MKTSFDQELPKGAAIVALHDQMLMLPGWPERSIKPEPLEHDITYWIRRNHFHNASLWAEEDLARRTKASDAQITANKRAIDRHNQARNDAIERMDELLLLNLGLVTPETAQSDAPVSRPTSNAVLNSETAGSMIDRLSILALKCHAMHAQTQRTDVDEVHRTMCLGRLNRLLEQRDDLAGCFDRLLTCAKEGTAWFKVYRQFKMYNDPAFNPALVAERSKDPIGAP